MSLDSLNVPMSPVKKQLQYLALLNQFVFLFSIFHLKDVTLKLLMCIHYYNVDYSFTGTERRNFSMSEHEKPKTLSVLWKSKLETRICISCEVLFAFVFLLGLPCGNLCNILSFFISPNSLLLFFSMCPLTSEKSSRNNNKTSISPKS